MKNEVNRAFMAKKKIFIYTLAALTLMACGKSKETATQEEERVEQVRTTVLQPREIEREISVSTNLQGYITQNVAPSLTGKIEHIYREVGDRVSAGSDLVRMDQTQYKTTKISMANLTIEKNRIEMLLKTGSATQQQYDQITTQYNSTKEQLEFLETNTYVKAPDNSSSHGLGFLCCTADASAVIRNCLFEGQLDRNNNAYISMMAGVCNQLDANSTTIEDCVVAVNMSYPDNGTAIVDLKGQNIVPTNVKRIMVLKICPVWGMSNSPSTLTDCHFPEGYRHYA